MRAVALIPFRSGGDEDRERAYDFVRRSWAKLGVEVFAGDSGHDRFNRAASRNDAARRAGDWDVGVFCDADTILEDWRHATAAIERARSRGILVHPHRKYGRLTRQATQLVLRGTRPARAMCFWRRTTQSPGAMQAVPRDLFNASRGWDEGFEGWGFEDTAFVTACAVLGGRASEGGFVYHLWHEESDRRSKHADDDVFQRNRRRWHKYQRAAGANDPRRAMRALLAELIP